MRVAILSDTHGNVDVRILDRIAGCELAVHGGDIGCAGVLDAIAPLVGRVLAVTGNNDLPSKWPPGEHKRLAAIPGEIRQALPGGLLVVTHGHQTRARDRHRRLRRRYPDARAVVYGHSHHLVADLEQTPWILNPGAAGRSRTYGGPSFLLLHAAEREWQVETHRLPPRTKPSERSPRTKRELQHTVKQD